MPAQRTATKRTFTLVTPPRPCRNRNPLQYALDRCLKVKAILLNSTLFNLSIEQN